MADFPFFQLRNRNASFPSSRDVKGPPDSHPTWRVFMGNRRGRVAELTKRMIHTTITADPDGGLSARVLLMGRMGGWEGYTLRVAAGYADQQDQVFMGQIETIYDHPNNTSEVLAFGGASVRGKQRLNKALDFSGLTLRQAMDYLNEVGAVGFRKYGMIGGHEYRIHDPDADPEEAKPGQPSHGFFPSEATWTEAERALLEPTDYVAYDNPEGHVIHKKPEIRYGGNPVNYTWWWTPNVGESRYPKGAFKFKAGTHQVYDRVIVFRRMQDYDEYVTTDQGAGKPKRVKEFYQVFAFSNTDHYVPDFNGSQKDAERESVRLANDLRTVKGEFEYEGPLRTWWPNDVVYIEQVEPRPNPRISYVTGVPMPAGDSTHVRSLYTCIIDGGYQQDIGKARFSARISGQAALHSMRASRSTAERTYRSTGLVPRIKPAPAGTIESSTYGEVV